MLFADLRRQKIAQIASIQQQIEDLQELLSQEQAHLQAIGSVEQSAESALTQVSNAIRGIQAICPSELETFKQQLLALFDGDFLPPGEDPIDTPPDTPIDNPPDTPIEAPATPIDAPTATPIGHTPPDPATTIGYTPDTTIDVPPTTIEAPTPKRRGRKPKAPPLAA